jgi:prepilin-type N-terminal cleavage/methylation domain-containing protein
MKSIQCLLQKKSRENTGFTLIETMIALFVFSVGVMAVMTMTVTSMNSFTRSRTTSVEVGKTALNLETLKEVGYNNSDVFQGTQVQAAGSDGDTVGYSDSQNTVVFETRLVVMQNTGIKGNGTGNTYQLCYTKPLVQ